MLHVCRPVVPHRGDFYQLWRHRAKQFDKTRVAVIITVTLAGDWLPVITGFEIRYIVRYIKNGKTGVPCVSCVPAVQGRNSLELPYVGVISRVTGFGGKPLITRRSEVRVLPIRSFNPAENIALVCTPLLAPDKLFIIAIPGRLITETRVIYSHSR